MSPRQTLQALPLWAKVAAVSVSLIGVGFAVRDYAGLPAQVAAHDKRIGEVEVIARRVDRQYTRIICLLTLPDNVTPIQVERACP